MSIDEMIDVQRDRLFRCWTEPALIAQWLTPLPWKTTRADMDVRARGFQQHRER